MVVNMLHQAVCCMRRCVAWGSMLHEAVCCMRRCVAWGGVLHVLNRRRAVSASCRTWNSSVARLIRWGMKTNCSGRSMILFISQTVYLINASVHLLLGVHMPRPHSFSHYSVVGKQSVHLVLVDSDGLLTDSFPADSCSSIIMCLLIGHWAEQL